MAGPVDPRLVRRARATKYFLVAGLGVGLATAILVIIQAWLLSNAVVSIFETHSLAIAGGLVIPILLVFLGRALLIWAQNVLAVYSAAAVKSQLRADIMRARLSRPTTAGTASSTLINLSTKGLDALDGYFAKYLPQLGLAATVPFIVGAVILYSDWPSAIIIAFTLPLIPVFMALIGWTTEKATASRFAVQTKLANHFADLVEGLPTLQAFGRAKAQSRGVEITEDAHLRETMRTLTISFLSALALELLATLSVAIIAVTIGTRLLYGNVDFETALFVLVLAPEAFLPVRQVGVHYHDSADGVAAADAAFKIIETGEDISGVENTSFDSEAETLASFDQVSYRYPGSEQLAVDKFSFEITSGEVVALAGTSGGGKSTILALLMGFIYPEEGKITLAGENVTDWQSKVAWVAQNPGLITGTVGENVAIGFADATDADIAQALADVGASFGADKHIGDDGEGLSAGERRRVALARALLRIRAKTAQLLVLDEPTAGLDAETEATALAAVRECGASAVVVSHRPAVLAAADRVISLEVTND
ncbi:MAG: thiol reductant ABC exporter subunit CydD [Propionibacterium sp.]|nr:MAG: thiol reductant ABC exporter subunit CydD [Propionibacterium sp.]